MIHTISKEAMDIIRRGGKCTYQEMEYLSVNTPCEDFPYENGYIIQYFLLIYLPEVKGYCSIYYEPTPLPIHRFSWIFGDTTDPPPHNHIDKETMQEEIHKLRGEEPYRLRFHDLAYIREFDSYDELKEYCRTAKQNKFFLDPRNDPEFKAVYDQGYYLNEKEFWALARYRNYCDFSDKTAKAYAVINLGEQERIYVEVSFWKDINSPFKPDYVVPRDSQGIFYIERNGKIFVPHYEGSMKETDL